MNGPASGAGDDPEKTPGEGEIVVPKEKAVFWMDGEGRWQNRHGRIRNPKIVAHFNRSIRRDAGGYHLLQYREGIREKVYFAFSETPLFVVDVALGPEPQVLLNTTRRHRFDPGALFIRNDALFMESGEAVFKFTDRAMMLLAGCMEDGEAGPLIRVGGVAHPIRTLD